MRSCSRKAPRRCSQDKGIDVAQEYDTPDWLPENAQKEMDQAITALGKDGFYGVLAANDGTAGGAIAALKGAGIDPSTIPVTGQDAELAGIQRVLAGEQYMTVYKPIEPLATNAATLAVAVVNGEDPADSDVINGTEDNGTEDVPAAITDTIPVFSDNVKDTVVKDGYWSVAGDLHAGSTPRPARTRESSRRNRYPDARGEGAMSQKPEHGGRLWEADTASQPLLALKGFTKSFGPVEALKDVDLEVYRGEVLGLVGDNGAGKSTLIKAVSGAQPADSGEATWEGRDHAADHAARRDRARDRDRISGPRVGREPRRGRQPVPGPGGRSTPCPASTSSTRSGWSRSRSSC